MALILLNNKLKIRPFAGIYNDIKRKFPHYLSDFTDSLNLQCLATTLYMYLVSLCSLVAFGGMLGKKTDNSMVYLVYSISMLK